MKNKTKKKKEKKICPKCGTEMRWTQSFGYQCMRCGVIDDITLMSTIVGLTIIIVGLFWFLILALF